jgi:hyperosmotically inducible protein
MIRALLRTVLIIVVLVGVGAFLVGYQWGDRNPAVEERPVGTTGQREDVDTSRARRTGAEVGEKIAIGANEAERALANAAVTAKIKSKLALDDQVSAARIDVDTNGDVVTLSGTVASEVEKSRAVRLARETEGVRTVVDRLVIRH